MQNQKKRKDAYIAQIRNLIASGKIESFISCLAMMLFMIRSEGYRVASSNLMVAVGMILSKADLKMVNFGDDLPVDCIRRSIHDSTDKSRELLKRILSKWECVLTNEDGIATDGAKDALEYQTEMMREHWSDIGENKGLLAILEITARQLRLNVDADIKAIREALESVIDELEEYTKQNDTRGKRLAKMQEEAF